jgi:hypothetical protein
LYYSERLVARGLPRLGEPANHSFTVDAQVTVGAVALAGARDVDPGGDGLKSAGADHQEIAGTRYPRSPSSTPWFAIFAASTYRRGIAGDAHPPASCSRSSGVPLRAARVAQ